MIDANQGINKDSLRKLTDASYERFRIQVFTAIVMLLADFEMSWDDLANKLQWKWNSHRMPIRYFTGSEVKKALGDNGYKDIDLEILNEVASVFSTEPYIIFKPRFPYTQT